MFFAGAMASASMHRVTFSVLAVPICAEFGLSLPQMGVLHSAVLAGYILGQVVRHPQSVYIPVTQRRPILP